MFFKSLYEVAKHTALSMIITPQGERLRVIIMPKPGKDAKEASALSKPIEATGTPEELDAELPKALAAYSEKVNDLRATISVPIEALDSAKAKAGKPKTAKPAKAAKKPKAPKAAKLAKAPKPKAPAQAKAKTPAKPRKAAAGSKTPTPRASLPGKDKCIEDLKAYLATGKDLNRAAFIAWARKNGNRTGRRFEKLWTGWHEFVETHSKPLDRISGAPLSESPPASKTAEPSPGSRKAAVAPEPARAVKQSKTVLDAAAKWPFPTQNKKPGDDAIAYPEYARQRRQIKEATTRVVYTDTGTLLGSCDQQLAVGDKYTHPDFGEYRAVKVEDEKYIVQRLPEEPPPDVPPAAKGVDLFKEKTS